MSYYNLLNVQSYILSYKAKGEVAPEDKKVAFAASFISNLTLDASSCSATRPDCFPRGETPLTTGGKAGWVPDRHRL